MNYRKYAVVSLIAAALALSSLVSFAGPLNGRGYAASGLHAAGVAAAQPFDTNASHGANAAVSTSSTLESTQPAASDSRTGTATDTTIDAPRARGPPWRSS